MTSGSKLRPTSLVECSALLLMPAGSWGRSWRQTLTVLVHARTVLTPAGYRCVRGHQGPLAMLAKNLWIKKKNTLTKQSEQLLKWTGCFLNHKCLVALVGALESCGVLGSCRPKSRARIYPRAEGSDREQQRCDGPVGFTAWGGGGARPTFVRQGDFALSPPASAVRAEHLLVRSGFL